MKTKVAWYDVLNQNHIFQKTAWLTFTIKFLIALWVTASILAILMV